MTSPAILPHPVTTFVIFWSKLSQRVRNNFWRSKNTPEVKVNPPELPVDKSLLS